MTSLSFLLELNCFEIRIIRDVLRVLIMITQLDKFIAICVLLLLIHDLHIFVQFLLVFKDNVCLVLKVGTPIFVFSVRSFGISNICIRLNEIIITLSVLGESMQSVSLVR